MSRYAWYKSKGICPRCGCEDAAPGRVYCLNCLDLNAIATMKWRGKNYISEKNKTYCKKRYAEAKEKGVCCRCFKRKAADGHSLCLYCLGKRRRT